VNLASLQIGGMVPVATTLRVLAQLHRIASRVAVR